MLLFVKYAKIQINKSMGTQLILIVLPNKYPIGIIYD